MNLLMMRIYLALKSNSNCFTFVFLSIAGRSPIQNAHPVASNVPKIIHCYWDKGYDQAPQLAKDCIRSWQYYNPDWELRIYDKSLASLYLNRKKFSANLLECHYADFLRIKLLNLFGGVWVDVTCLCLRSLDEWLPMIMMQGTFFAFRRPSYDNMISNWFLASAPQGLIIETLDNTLDKDATKKCFNRAAYHTFHHIFEYLCIVDSSFRKEWFKTLSLAAPPIHLLQQSLREGKLPSSDRVTALKNTPLQKLSNKHGLNEKLLRKFLISYDFPVMNCLK